MPCEPWAKRIGVVVSPPPVRRPKASRDVGRRDGLRSGAELRVKRVVHGEAGGVRAWLARQAAPLAGAVPGLHGLGIGDRPPKPLDELFRRMLGAEMYRVDLLVEQHRGATALGVLGCHYDSGSVCLSEN